MNYVESDPDNLLDSIKPHLDKNGGIKDTSIPELIKLMSESEDSLVPKCISVCIIGASQETVQLKIIETEGWDIMLKWLQKSIQQDDYSFLFELLSVYNQLPINMSHLTKNVCPKLINIISRKCSDQKSKELAGIIVKKWKQLINVEPGKKSPPPAVINGEPPIKKKKDIPNEVVKDKKRRTTVKIPHTVMRTAGVEKEALKTPKPRSEVTKKLSPNPMNNPPADSLESLHQKINLVSSSPVVLEPKKIERHESADFINALTTSSSNLLRKKKKINKPDQKTDSNSPNYNILDINNLNRSLDSTLNSSANEYDTDLGEEKDTLEKKSSIADFNTVFSTSEKDRKRVSWAPEEDLISVRYFVVEENERVNVTKMNPEDIRRKEMNMDRLGIKRSEDKIQWRNIFEIDVKPVIEIGNKSEERIIQQDRERFVLQALYFSEDSVPPQPGEPDPQEFEVSVPVEIPLDDNKPTTNLLVKDSEQGDKVSLNPMLADLVKSLAQKCEQNPSSNICNSNNTSLTNNNTSKSPSIYGQSGYSINNTFDNKNSSFNDKSDKIITYDDNHNSNNHYDNRPHYDSYYDSVNNDSESHEAPSEMQHKIWEILEKNYPDLQVRELSEERIRELLRPLKDQLIERGIVPAPPQSVYPHHNEPGPHSSYPPYGCGPKQRGSIRIPLPHDRYPGPPLHMYHPYPMPMRMGPNGPMYPPRPRPGMMPFRHRMRGGARIDGPPSRGRIPR